jgi:putative ABC transport system permease protein
MGSTAWDLVLEGLDGLMAHRVRSMLSTLGILFGVAAIIGILSIGEGARREQERMIAQLGILNFQITAVDLEDEDDDRRKEILRKSEGLSLRDVAALRAVLPDAVHVGGMIEVKVRDIVPRPPEDSKIEVMGAEPDYLASSNLVVLSGRSLTQRDEERVGQVALIGRGVARDLFKTERAVGRRLRLGRVWVTVVGVVTDGSGGSEIALEGIALRDRNRDIILPLSSARARFRRESLRSELDEIQVAVGAPNQVLGHSMLARAIVDRLHREQPDTTWTVPIELLTQSREQQRIFNLVMGLIAGISLLIGGIGIMNIMLASVLERTREIGIRLAVGATPWDIRLLFLSEASLISLVGGVLGIGAGYAISSGVAIFTGWSTAVPFWAVALAAGLSMAEGVIFGLLPAQRAANLAPVLAIRNG